MGATDKMVLGDHPPPKDSLDDSAPTSDDDPYSSTSSPIRGRPSRPTKLVTDGIDFQSLPKPIPILGALLGYNQKHLIRAMDKQAMKFAQILPRPPTQEESNAIAYWTARQISIFSYGTPIGVAGGAWRAWNTNSQFRFPWYRPSPSMFFEHEFFGILKGNRAVLAWHALRYLAYGFVGASISQVFLLPYALVSTAVGEVTDPRMKAYTDALRQKSRRVGPIDNAKQRDRYQTSSVQSTEDAALSRDTPDDASPSGGFEEGNFEDAPTEAVRKPQYQSPQYQNTRARPAVSQVETQDQPFDAFDDASPTGGQDLGYDAPAAQGASAWDRVRSGNNSNINSSGNSSAGWTSARKPQSSSPKPSDKDNAQRQFDAQVERERRGGDFSDSGGGDQKRW